jgi:hypothetical protein
MNQELTGLRFDSNKPSPIEFFQEIMKTPLGDAFLESLFIKEESATPVLTPAEFQNLTVTAEEFLEFLEDFKPALMEVARQVKYGAVVKGYGKRNWLGGMLHSRVVDSTVRHMLKFIFLKDKHDKESGSLHATAAAWGSLAYLTYIKSDLGQDDL